MQLTFPTVYGLRVTSVIFMKISLAVLLLLLTSCSEINSFLNPTPKLQYDFEQTVKIILKDDCDIYKKGGNALFKCDGTYEKFYVLSKKIIKENTDSAMATEKKQYLKNWEKNKNNMAKNWETVNKIIEKTQQPSMMITLCTISFGDNLIGVRKSRTNYGQNEKYKMQQCDNYYLSLFENYLRESNPKAYELIRAMDEIKKKKERVNKEIVREIYNYSVAYEKRQLKLKEIAYGTITIQEAIIQYSFQNNQIYNSWNQFYRLKVMQVFDDSVLITPEGISYQFNEGFMKNAIIKGTKNYSLYDGQVLNGYFIYIGREQYISLLGRKTVPVFKILNDKKFIIDKYAGGEINRYLRNN